jgi:hypothetical protein
VDNTNPYPTGRDPLGDGSGVPVVSDVAEAKVAFSTLAPLGQVGLPGVGRSGLHVFGVAESYEPSDCYQKALLASNL